MSIQAVAWAINQKTGSPAGKVVLMCIANYADEAGECWPSQATIAEETELSERSVREWLTRLEEAGLLMREHRQRADGSRKSDLIKLNIQPAKSTGREQTNRQEVPNQPAGGSGLTSFEPSVEPSAAAREKPDLDKLQDRLLDAVGDGNIQPHGALDLSIILGLMAGGADLETDILPTIRARAARLKRPAGSWAYFAEAIRDAHNRRVEAGQGLCRPKQTGPATWEQGLTADEQRAKWAKTLDFARPRDEWLTWLWGPPPGQDGCRVPPDMLEPRDLTRDWTEQKKQEAA